VTKWRYVGEADALRRAVEDVLWAWDVLRDSEAVNMAMGELRNAIYSQRRMAWTDDYYDLHKVDK
jgi:hypothetical protein